MAQHRCPSCGASVTALVTEEVIRAAGKPIKQGSKIKALKTEHKTLRGDVATLKAQLTEKDAQLRAAGAEAQALRAASAASAATAKEEAAVPGRVGKKRVIQMTPAQARVMGNMRNA